MVALRYHGVLASNSAVRAEVVPKKKDELERAAQLPLFSSGEPGHLEPPPEPSRHPWDWLLARVFRLDVSECPECGGRMRIVQIAPEPDAAARVLAELGMRARPHGSRRNRGDSDPIATNRDREWSGALAGAIVAR